ncbi:MAG: hypothetical protein ACPLXS_03420 [Candidatus Micrarchaeales archaeon]|jgi:hypothetical protein
MAEESLAEVMEALKKEYGEAPKPAEALKKEEKIISPEAREKMVEILKKIAEIEAKGLKKAGEVISKAWEKYKKEKELKEAVGEKPRSFEEILKETEIEVYTPELGVYKR